MQFQKPELSSIEMISVKVLIVSKINLYQLLLMKQIYQVSTFIFSFWEENIFLSAVFSLYLVQSQPIKLLRHELNKGFQRLGP